LMVVGVINTDGTMTQEDISDYVAANMKDAISRTSGEGYPTSVRNGKWRLIYSGEGCMGKGGGKAHTPREAKDNLKSTQMMSVIDALREK
ncbi:hypothetical protein MMO67_28675, partial [Escherichia coli]|nr:hypothetical protein [Escherichia coli]